MIRIEAGDLVKLRSGNHEWLVLEMHDYDNYALCEHLESALKERFAAHQLIVLKKGENRGLASGSHRAQAD